MSTSLDTQNPSLLAVVLFITNTRKPDRQKMIAKK